MYGNAVGRGFTLWVFVVGDGSRDGVSTEIGVYGQSKRTATKLPEIIEAPPSSLR